MQLNTVKLLPKQILSTFQAALGDIVHVEDTRDGQLSGSLIRVYPTTEEELCTAIAIAYEHALIVKIEGAGSQVGIGNPVQNADVIISSKQMNRVVAYSPADLVVTVEPGVTLGQLNQVLAEHRQMLPLDPVCSPEATIGGILSTGVTGPLRTGYGTLRDMAIGLHVVYPDGQMIQAGGKVVKNVAGYDMTKLFIGSMGTLAFVSEITFKLRPAPTYAELCLIAGDSVRLQTIVSQIVDSNLLPSRLEILRENVVESPAGTWVLAVECHENEDSAAFQTNALKNLASQVSLEVDVVQGTVACEAFWTHYQQTMQENRTTVRLSAAPNQILRLSEGFARDAELANLPCTVSVGPMSGVARFSLQVRDAESFVTWLKRARNSLPADAAMVIERNELKLQSAIDAFGPPGADIALMKSIKATIDPKRMFNPGAFIGGI